MNSQCNVSAGSLGIIYSVGKNEEKEQTVKYNELIARTDELIVARSRGRVKCGYNGFVNEDMEVRWIKWVRQ